MLDGEQLEQVTEFKHLRKRLRGKEIENMECSSKVESGRKLVLLNILCVQRD